MANINYFNNEFQTAGGWWHCINAHDLGNGSNIWWKFPRLINMPLDKFVELLVNEFNVSRISYSIEHDVLLFSWDNQTDMRKFKNWANREYRKVVLNVN